jgi:hypothetical protein
LRWASSGVESLTVLPDSTVSAWGMTPDANKRRSKSVVFHVCP